MIIDEGRSPAASPLYALSSMPAWLLAPAKLWPNTVIPTWHILSERIAICIEVVKWGLVMVPLAMAIGLACSSLLYFLKKVTDLRDGLCVDRDIPLASCQNIENSHRWLLFLLPISGVLVAWLYEKLGNAKAKGGANTLINEIGKLEQGAEGTVPFRMSVLVFVGTVFTHLTGGSAGREGTALQIGVSFGSTYMVGIDRCYEYFTKQHVAPEVVHTILVASLACGFAGIFGVPLTGTVFALEMLKVGGMRYEAFLPSVIGAYTADWMCRTSNQYIFEFEGHSEYYCAKCRAEPQAYGFIDFSELIAIVPAAIVFGICSLAFSTMIHIFKQARAPTRSTAQPRSVQHRTT